MDRSYPQLASMAAASRWLSSPRQLVEVSSASADLLQSFEPRFYALPLVMLSPWRSGFLFSFSDTGQKTLAYVEPLEGKYPGIRYIVWVQDRLGRWGTVVPKDLSLESRENGELDTYTALSHSMGYRGMLAITETGERIDVARLRNVCINALSAMTEDPDVVLMGDKSPPRRTRRRSRSLSPVKRLTLSFDGTRLVTRKWNMVDAPPAEEKIEHAPHGSPGEHKVEPHQCKRWVNEPRPGEEVLDTCERTRKDGTTYLQHCVKRIRGKDGSYVRGEGPLKGKGYRMVTGPEDLNTKVSA